MPTVRELFRVQSGARTVFEMLDKFGPQTQLQLSARIGITLGYTCKCLQLLEDHGYACRLRETLNSKGNLVGKRPMLYGRTSKPLEMPSALDVATPVELREIMNRMIRRKCS